MLYCALFWYCAFIKYIPLLFSEIPQILFQYLFAALSISRLLHKYIPKDERDSKARKCFLLGYDQGTKVKMIKCLSQIQIIRLMTITAVDFSNCEVPPRSSQLTCQLLNPLLEGQNEKATSRFMERANACT